MSGQCIGRIKKCALISQDHRVMAWPTCMPPKSHYPRIPYVNEALDPDMLFICTKRLRGDEAYWDCKSNGYGMLCTEVGEYGNGSIYVNNMDDIEMLSPLCAEGVLTFDDIAQPVVKQKRKKKLSTKKQLKETNKTIDRLINCVVSLDQRLNRIERS